MCTSRVNFNIKLSRSTCLLLNKFVHIRAVFQINWRHNWRKFEILVNTVNIDIYLVRFLNIEVSFNIFLTTSIKLNVINSLYTILNISRVYEELKTIFQNHAEIYGLRGPMAVQIQLTCLLLLKHAWPTFIILCR